MMAEVHPPLVHSGALSQPDANLNSSQTAIASKKSKETERRRRRRKQKKNNKTTDASTVNDAYVTEESDGDATDNFQNQKVVEQVIIEYVPEKAEIDGIMDEEFRKIFEKFTFTQPVASEEMEKKDEAAETKSKKKDDSDSDEEDQDDQQKEKGVSNKKKKLERRMKIGELKQISSRPDVVEVWDATAADPKLLVYLKSYRNTVPVPRHWSQKRKFLQGNCCDTPGETG